ncbi:cyclopropane fatty acyl phospholipid synthase [Legionella fairfieldensis]|uniref:cyclopropane fatty acyl phospholipid synthase n=1 Tax=Legionella fairfieldensis TaxID=45064 RepID=UPI00048B2464|nr:cyclopropane fatty acyl phospholipid synthase [Legionella fairfieldensis]
MNNAIAQNYVQRALSKAEVTLNGSKDHDIQLIDNRAIKRILLDGSLGLGETYMEGWWDCKRLDKLSYQLCTAALEKDVKFNFFHLLYKLSAKLFNQQSKKLSKEVAEKHYDLDNHLFALMLGETMAYSCGYWKNTQELNTAQRAKYELICKKLQLTSQDTLLDIGCGWGGLAAYAAEHYGCRVVGISIAEQQIAYAKEHHSHLPAQFFTADYRDSSLYNPQQKQFTKLVSVGAFEHIGPKNYRTFFKLMEQQLTDNGLFLLHTIGSNETVTSSDRWINKYIFPHGILPSMKQLSGALERSFIIEDWHNIGIHYDNTLLAWNKNFEAHWDTIKSRFDERFYRMWRYYLLMCAGMFRSRTAQVWQLVMSKSGLREGYESIR